MAKRQALSRSIIIEAAVAVADRGGLTAVSMRNVGAELGVEAMSLYHHVKNKSDLLDALADWVFALVRLPGIDEPWRDALIARSASAREVLSQHKWGLGLLESRSSPGPAVLAQHNAVLGCLKNNGFSLDLAGHAFSVIDAYVYGFVLTEVSLPFEQGGAEDFVDTLQVLMADYPYLAEFAEHQIVGREYEFANEFDVGLEIILDELQRRLG